MRIALLFNSVFSILVIILAGAASWRIPIKYVALPALAVTLILAALSLRKIFAGRRRGALIVGVVVMCGSVGFAVGPNALRGGFPSENPDCWAYAAFGQYLTDFPRGTKVGLPYVDEFAQVLSNTRFASATLLAFLGKTLNTNTARAIVIFDVIVLVNCFLGCFCVTRSFGATLIPSLASATFFVCNGWTVRAIREGQLDNLIFLSLVVFALARTLLLLRNVSSRKALIGLGANIAAACYSYPEGAAIAASFGLPFGIAVVFWVLRDSSNRWKKVTIIIGCTALLVAPYLPIFGSFLSNQIGATTGSVLPGKGMFPGLAKERMFPAVFALGEEMSKARIERWRLILPSVFSLLILLGVFRNRFRWPLVASLCILTGAVCFELIKFRYDYAAYKFIFAGTIIWVPMIFVGTSWLSGSLPKQAESVSALGFAAIIVGGTLAQRACSPYTAPFHDAPLANARRIRKYEEIKGLQRLINDSTLVIACNDPFKYLWAYYFARDFSLELMDIKSYFVYSPEILSDRRRSVDPPRFVLSDQRDSGEVWQNGEFWLFRVSNQPHMALARPENALEMLDGEDFTWIGNNPTQFEIISATKGKIRFSCREVVDGPSLPEKAVRSIKASVNGQAHILKAQDLYAFDFEVNRGVTSLEISCLDGPTQPRQANGDTRIMLVGLKGFRVARLHEE